MICDFRDSIFAPRFLLFDYLLLGFRSGISDLRFEIGRPRRLRTSDFGLSFLSPPFSLVGFPACHSPLATSHCFSITCYLLINIVEHPFIFSPPPFRPLFPTWNSGLVNRLTWWRFNHSDEDSQRLPLPPPATCDLPATVPGRSTACRSRPTFRVGVFA